MPESDSGHFQTSRRQVQTAISVDVEMGIRKTDWRRVHRKVRSIPRDTSLYEVVESVAWGVAAAALLSLIPLYQATQGTEPWVKPTYIAVGLAAAVLAALARHFGKARRAIIHSTCEEVLMDMEEVYRSFFPQENLNQNGS